MPLNILFGRRAQGKIGSLKLDATVSENHIYNSEVTSFPVEDGSTITDHVRKQPISLSMTGFITNSPIKFLAGVIDARARQSGRESYIELARDYLIDLHNKSMLIDIETGLMLYLDMIMKTLTIPRGQPSQDVLRFTAEFVEILKVDSEIVKIANVSDLDGRAAGVNDQGQNKADTGRQTPKDASPEEEKKVSWLKSIIYSF